MMSSMIKHSPGTTPHRVVSITITDTTFEIVGGAHQGAVLFSILDRCVAPAEQRVHHANDVGDSDSDVPAALAKIEVWFPWHTHDNTSLLQSLIENYPALVRSLQVLMIEHSKYDESAELGTFAAVATQLRELTFSCCGLTSVRGLAGCCECLRRVDLSGCKRLASIDALAEHTHLESVNVACTSITSIEPLRSCPALTEVVASGCEHLSSIEALEGHQWLQEVDVSDSDITSIEPLRTCPALMEVDVSGCQMMFPADVSFPASVNIRRCW